MAQTSIKIGITELIKTSMIDVTETRYLKY